jgi:basic membrane protein A and related proteins
VSIPSTTLLRLAVALVGAALLASGCSSDDEPAAVTSESEPAPTTTAAPSSAPALRIGVVTNAVDRADPAAGALAAVGMRRAEQLLRVHGEVVVVRRPDAFVTSLRRFAADDYDLVFGVGAGAAAPVEQVADKFPDVDFAVVDVSQAGMTSKPPNVRGLLFKEEEAGYLVGYLAALLNARESGSQQTIGSVGGRKVPWVDRYIAGFHAGAKKANPRITTLNGYSQTFVDQAKCKEIALGQIARGADVVFQVAGQCGLGTLSAAEEKNVWGVGVDGDQARLGDHVLTSALKKIDVAVFETVQAMQEGSFTGGEDVVFDVASGGVGLGDVSDQVPADVLARVQAVQDDLAAGKIADIPHELP